jgi:endonuclease/exonuclease/phosphatase family metal-dependent hydrolase
VFLVQGVSDVSPLSYWVPVWDEVRKSFEGGQVFFRPDVATWGLPWPLALNHGTVIATRANPSAIETVAIPNEPGLMMGFLRRRYALQVVRVPIEGQTGEWVVANLHLSAFDDGGVTRIEQLKAVLKFGADEYAKGNHVILGGDWNMRLSATSFPNTTEEKYLFWLMDFPHDQLAAGWSIVSDPKLPTVRTLHKPYVAGENYTTIIDGFIVSPNVMAQSVTTHDTGFAISDHMPQTAVFTAKP